MAKQFRVHSAHKTQVGVPSVTTDGHAVTGYIDAMIVELVPLTAPGGTLTITEIMPTPEDVTRITALYAKDNVVAVDFTLVQGA